MGVILLEGCLLILIITDPWLKLVTFGISIMMLKSLELSFNNFCNSNAVYILFYTWRTWWKDLTALRLIPMDATCWVTREGGIETPWRLLLKTSFHRLLSFTFVNFLICYWPLSLDIGVPFPQHRSSLFVVSGDWCALSPTQFQPVCYDIDNAPFSLTKIMLFSDIDYKDIIFLRHWLGPNTD